MFIFLTLIDQLKNFSEDVIKLVTGLALMWTLEFIFSIIYSGSNGISLAAKYLFKYFI